MSTVGKPPAPQVDPQLIGEGEPRIPYLIGLSIFLLIGGAGVVLFMVFLMSGGW